MQNKPLMLPFEISAEQASHIFQRYISRNKLNSTEMFEAARQHKVSAAYFPVFIYDCQVKTTATARCSKRDNGQITEYTARREVNSQFSQAVSVAGSKVDATLFSLIEPYGLEELIPFDAALIKGAEIQPTAADSGEVFASVVKPTLEKAAALEIKRSLNEYTDSSITDISHDFVSITAKQALLPLWILEGEHKGLPCPLFLNGQTGKTAGIPPKSTSKVVALFGAAAAVGAVLGQLIWMAVSQLW